MILQILLAAASDSGGQQASDVVTTLFTNIITTGVIAALITSGVQFFSNRRNARIQERKNAVDTESDLVARYKDAAAEERAQKESAVKTIKDLLTASEAQVASLKDTVLALNETIDLMSRVADSQKDIIKRLEIERDRLDSARDIAERVRDEKIAELEAAEKSIREMRKKQEELDTAATQVFGNLA